MVTQNDFTTETKAKKYYNISIIILLWVVFLNIWLYFYNWYLEWKNNSIQEQITQTDESIKKIYEDPKVSLYTMIQNNSKFIDKYKNISKITEYINNLKKLSLITKIEFNWFSYADWKLSSNALAQDDSNSLASVKVEKFLSKFRKWDQKDNFFNLWFVNSFDWQKNITFSLSLEVK